MTQVQAIPGLHPAPTRHARLVAWVEQIAALTKPDRVHWCDGSEAEKAQIVADLIDKGTLRALNPEKRPGSYYAASDPKDVARNSAPSGLRFPTAAMSPSPWAS